MGHAGPTCQLTRSATRPGNQESLSELCVARLLLLLANFGKEGEAIPINQSITQDTPAEMTGTTRSRVSFFLNKFRKLGLISYNGKIEVHQSLLNAVLYEKPELTRHGKADVT
jgi:CRP-like cAMP-binding protein